MSVRRWLVAVVVVAALFGGVGFVAGREYLKWELRTALQKGVDDMGAAFRKASGDARKSMGDDFAARLKAIEARRKAEEEKEKAEATTRESR
jgi:hypothetical protein